MISSHTGCRVTIFWSMCQLSRTPRRTASALGFSAFQEAVERRLDQELASRSLPVLALDPSDRDGWLAHAEAEVFARLALPQLELLSDFRDQPVEDSPLAGRARDGASPTGVAARSTPSAGSPARSPARERGPKAVPSTRPG